MSFLVLRTLCRVVLIIVVRQYIARPPMKRFRIGFPREVIDEPSSIVILWLTGAEPKLRDRKCFKINSEGTNAASIMVFYSTSRFSM